MNKFPAAGSAITFPRLGWEDRKRFSDSVIALPHSETFLVEVFTWFLAGIVFVLVSDVKSDLEVLFFFSRFLLCGTLLSSIFVSPKRAAQLLLLVCLPGLGVLDLGGEGQVTETASLWLLKLGPINPTWIVFGCIGFQFIKLGKLVKDQTEIRAIRWFFTVPIITGCLTGGFSFETSWIFTDIKLGIMLLTSIVFFRTVIRTWPQALPSLMSTFLGVILARYGLDFIYAFANSGPSFGIGNVISLDSAKGLVVYLLFLAIVAFVIKKQFLFPLLLGGIASFLLVAYSTRLLYVTPVLGMVLLLPVVNVKRLLLAGVGTMTIFTIGIFVLVSFRPDTALGAFMRAQTLTGNRIEKILNVEDNFLSRLDPVRYAEMLNILHTMMEHKSFLLGSGYGSYYTDDVVPFPKDLLTGFTAEELISGNFHGAHDYCLHLFFKHGLVGLVIISMLWIKPVSSVLRLARLQPNLINPQSSTLALCILAAVPFSVTGMMALYWSGKGLFVNGFILAILSEYAYLHRSVQGHDSPQSALEGQVC